MQLDIHSRDYQFPRLPPEPHPTLLPVPIYTDSPSPPPSPSPLPPSFVANMDLVPGINIGAGLDALIDQLDEIDNSRAVKRKRVTLDQAQTVQNREELIQWSEDLITGPPLKQKRLLALFHRFIRYHSEGIRPIGGGNMVGKERDKWTLVSECPRPGETAALPHC